MTGVDALVVVVDGHGETFLAFSWLITYWSRAVLMPRGFGSFAT